MQTTTQPVRPATKMIVAQEKTMFEALLSIQKELQTVGKNKTGFKGKYADIEAVWESIRKVVNDNGFVIRHESSKEGIQTVAMYKSGESISSFIPFSEKTDPQERGKEITYAKRYNIGAIFNVIVADEDNDANKQLGDYKKKEVNGDLAAKKLLGSKNIEESREIYKSLSTEERKTKEVIAAVDYIKKNLK